MAITASVGRGGVNHPDDVRLIQRLLNDARVPTGSKRLAVDGIAGPKTQAAIEQYQQANGLPTDGRIDPRGPTLRHLLERHLKTLTADLKISVKPGPGNPPKPDRQLIVSGLREYLARLRR